MQLVQRADVTGADADALWTLYSRAFGRRRRNRPGAPAPMPRELFDLALHDLRITKFLVVDLLEGRSVAAFATLGPAVGLRELLPVGPGNPASNGSCCSNGSDCSNSTACSNGSSDGELPDPRRLVDRWPEQLRQGRVWHLGLMAVDPGYCGTSAAAHLVTGVLATAAASGGVITVDLDAVHEVEMHLPTMLYEVARTFSRRIRLHPLPGSSCWAYEFPAPVPA
ncbi:MAG: family N-acetyltransferase [Actinomycetota bacterium]|nr:family N-acetyltransferase [Actinomycetota bacterium]